VKVYAPSTAHSGGGGGGGDGCTKIEMLE